MYPSNMDLAQIRPTSDTFRSQMWAGSVKVPVLVKVHLYRV